MQSTPSLIKHLRNDFKQFQFRAGEDFYWSPGERTIFYSPTGHPAFLLHELGHALQGHRGYTRDVQLVELEREAWEYTQAHLSKRYDIEINDNIVENAIDSYREWLHARSICPVCVSTGVQTQENTYSCLVCFASWRVNEARLCGLKRKLLTTK